MEWRLARQPIVLRRSRLANPRDRRNRSGSSVHLAHDVVPYVANNKIAQAVELYAVRGLQLRLGCWPSIASVTRCARSGDRGDFTRRTIKATNPMIASIDDYKIPSRIEANLMREVQGTIAGEGTVRGTPWQT